MTPPMSRFDAVCFDCDSTLSRIEGIDELARRCGFEMEISLLTNAAMNGSLPIDAIYAKRLSIVRPDEAAVAWLGDRYVEELVPGAKETVDTLHRLGKAVYIVSGGLRPAVERLAWALSVPISHVHAVAVHFDGDGRYCGFDESSSLYRKEGKAEVCRQLLGRHARIAMVGDGITDLDAQLGGACVVGFGGVVYREIVARNSDHFVGGPRLTATLDVLLSDEELRSRYLGRICGVHGIAASRTRK